MATKKEYQRLYRLKNKEKLKEKNRLYRLNNKEKLKEKNRLYRLNNKEKLKEKRRLYRLANKEKLKEKTKEYKLKNKEKIKQKQKEYRQTEAGKKSGRICNWKRYGLKDHYEDNYETIYKMYSLQKNCSVCNKIFNDKNRMDLKCLDHCHNTGKLRRICCVNCNVNVVK